MSATLFDVESGRSAARSAGHALRRECARRSDRDAQQPTRSDEFGLSTEASVGDYGTRIGRARSRRVRSSALDSAWRLGVQRYRSDGFRDDPYLGRDDTNDRDELTARAKWRWRAERYDTTVDFTWLHADLDNGYDAWSIDNSRRSLADRPGKDAQQADGGRVRVETRAGRSARLTRDRDGVANPTANTATTRTGAMPRAGRRTRTTISIARSARDAHAASKRACIGRAERRRRHRVARRRVCARLSTTASMKQRGGDVHRSDFPEYSGSRATIRCESTTTRRTSRCSVSWTACLTERWGWSFGLRAEQRSADYSDHGMQDEECACTDAERARSHVGWPGDVALRSAANTRVVRHAVARLQGRRLQSRPGGQRLSERFAPEYLWSLDVGVKGEWLERRLYADITAFYMRREDMQVSTGIQLDPIGVAEQLSSSSRTTRRAAATAGIEASARWRATNRSKSAVRSGCCTPAIRAIGPTASMSAIAIRRTRRNISCRSTRPGVSRSAGWRASISRRIDDYYFDVPPADQRAAAYSLTHLKAGYEGERWSAYVWSRNVFDEEYVVRGFYFANEPPRSRTRVHATRRAATDWGECEVAW